MELISAPQARPEPAQGVPPPADIAAPPSAPEDDRDAPVLAHAGTLLSSGALDAIGRRSLVTLAAEERIEQLCGVEAMEQVAREQSELRPERVVVYATADAELAGDVLTAEGAAILSEGNWYRLSFRCRATPDHLKVLSFDFATGSALDEATSLQLGSTAAD